MSALVLTYPVLPPSENHIRQIRWMRKSGQKPKAVGMTYTAEAEGYKREFREYVRTNCFVAVQKFRRDHRPFDVYVLKMLFHFAAEDLLNKGWLKRGKARAKTPYKRMDVGNRRKLLEDCFSEAIDVDDSLNFGVEMYKFVSTEPRVELVLEKEDPRSFGVPEAWLID